MNILQLMIGASLGLLGAVLIQDAAKTRAKRAQEPSPRDVKQQEPDNPPKKKAAKKVAKPAVSEDEEHNEEGGN